jgi:CheY-like chemotaxis protein
MPRILSLDDEPGMLEMYGLLLKRTDYEYISTMDEQEALSILRTQTIDLFTQDFHRAGLGGYEFLRLMKADEKLRDIPVLGISLWPREARVKGLESVGLDIDRDLAGYLLKLAIVTDLIPTIDAILAKHVKN